MRELLCIQTHSQGLVKAGKVYYCIQEVSNACACGKVIVDVGVRGVGGSYCVTCGVFYNYGGIKWFSKKLFAEIATESEVAEMSKHETVQI